MENKKLRQRIAARLIDNELSLWDKEYFAAGVRLPRGNVIEGLVNFVLTMIAGEEDKQCKQVLKKRILANINKLARK